MAGESAEHEITPGDARAGETALREVLAVMARSRGDEAPVLDVILGHARRLCEAPLAAVALAQAGDAHQVLAAHHGATPQTVGFYEAGGVPMDPARSFTARAILERRTIHLVDMADTREYRSGVPNVVELVEQQGIRTNLFVPLVSGGEGTGALILFRTEVRPFTDDQIALVEAFAAQAVIAIENVKQFREVQAALARQTASANILRMISSSPDDVRPVFEEIVRSAVDLVKCDLVTTLMREGDVLNQVAVATPAGLQQDPAKIGVPIDPAQNFPSRSLQENRLLHIEDWLDYDLPDHEAGVQQRLGVRSSLSLPLVRDEARAGVLIFVRKYQRAFTQAEIDLAQSFADQAVIALQNVRLFRALQARTDEVQQLNASLEARVAAQVGEIERMGRLKRFLSPAVADAVVSSGDDRLLSSHRALIATLFCDIRGFTAFCETAEPEETIEVLQSYHEAMGALIAEHGGGVDHRMGDGIMVIFNDPLPCDDPAGDALRLALAMRERMAGLCRGWKRLGHRLGFGVGISLGYATVGMVGSEGRFEYTASGTAVNLAARLCDEAADGEILLSPRAYAAVEDDFSAEPRGEFTLKGIQAPVEVFRVTGARGDGTADAVP